MEIKYPKHLNTQEFKILFEAFIDTRKKLKKPLTEFAIALTLKKLSKFSLEECTQAVENTILNGWLGIFPKKSEDDYFSELEEGL